MSKQVFKSARTDEEEAKNVAPRASLYDWRPISDVPLTRPVFLTSDPDSDKAGILAQWRTTRVKEQGVKGWKPISFWSSVLSRKPLDFEPTFWRESMDFSGVSR